MVTFSELVAFAGEQDPEVQVAQAATAFLSLTGFSGLILTRASADSKRHQVFFSDGYPAECVDHVCSSYVIRDPHYGQIKNQTRPLGWHGEFEHGFEARTWLIPAGYKNGSSVSVQDASGIELGSIHTNTRREILSDRQLESLESLRVYLSHAFAVQVRQNELGMTSREVDVIRLIIEGASNLEIAESLFVSRRTVATHIENILRKMDAHSRVEIAVIAIRLGIV